MAFIKVTHKGNNEPVYVNVDQVIYIDSDGNNARMHFNSATIPINLTAVETAAAVYDLIAEEKLKRG